MVPVEIKFSQTESHDLYACFEALMIFPSSFCCVYAFTVACIISLYVVAAARLRKSPQAFVQAGDTKGWIRSKIHPTSEFHPLQSISGGVRFLSSLPSDLQPGASPRGLFVLFHGCQRSAESFFHLPEESAMTAAVLKRGFAVMAVDTVIPRVGDCWDMVDAPKLAQALVQAKTHPSFQKIPLYGLGVSSGGMMLARLVGGFRLPFAGLIFNVSPHRPELFTGNTVWPRTSFVHAKYDNWAPPNMVLAAAKLLQQRGTPVQVLSTGPKPLHELPLFASRLGIQPGTLSLVVDILFKAGFVKVLPDPTVHSRKHVFLAPAAADAAFDYLRKTSVANILAALPDGGRGLREEMHVLAGIHGVTSEYFNKALDFIVEQNEAMLPVATSHTAGNSNVSGPVVNKTAV